MTIKKLHDPDEGQMRIVGLMSRSGSNLRKIIEQEKTLEKEKGYSPYHVAVIFTDNYESKATELGKDYDLPIIVRGIKSFYAVRGKPRKDLIIRAEYDSETVKALAPYDAKVAAYAGYMSIATKPLINAYLGLNVHPADLSILNPNGTRKYVRHNTIYDAIINHEESIRSTVHLIDSGVDLGPMLMRSSPLSIDYAELSDSLLELKLNKSYACKKIKEIANKYQELLKQNGDWMIYPKTILYLAEGRFGMDDLGHLYFDDKPIPNGITLEEIIGKVNDI